MQTIQAFSSANVVVNDGYLCNAAKKELDYLLSLDSDRLLSSFRSNAGLLTQCRPYDGWENSLIGGHTIGHYLTALSQAYVSTFFVAAQKDAIRKKLDGIVDELAKCQENSRGKEGFLWGGTVLDPKNVEFQFDCVEEGKTNIKTEAWVPWYTMHKIIAGLVAAYRLAGNAQALEVAVKLGKWTYRRVRRLTKKKRLRVLSVEYGGMNDCLYDLYDVTRDEDFALAAHFFDEEILVNKILDGGGDYLNKMHANTTIPKFIGLAKRYLLLDGKKIGHKKVEARECFDAAEQFWDMVVDHHTYVTGGNSEWEAFGLDDVLDAERTSCNCETCNAYNMLKLSSELFSFRGRKKYLDYCEKTLINSILASQNPETGMTTYFQPMASGYFKVFSEPYDKFWCCTGSGMESFTKLGDNFYYHIANCLIVAQYFSSSVAWTEKGVRLTQEADMEHSDKVRFRLEGECDLAFRIPDWAKSFSLTKNGARADEKTECGFVLVHGQDGDVFELVLEKTLKVHTLPDDKDVYAISYGPYVLAAAFGQEDMRTTTTGVDVTIPAEKKGAAEILETEAPVSEFMEKISEHCSEENGVWTLQTDPQLKLVPYFRLYKHRYGIYFYFFEKGKGKEKFEGQKTVLDTVRPGYGQYETDIFHDMREENSVSDTANGTCRYARSGGRFCYRMTVSKDKPTSLVICLKKADNGKSLLVTAGNRVIMREKLAYTGDKDIYERILPIPAEATAEFEAVHGDGEVRCMLQICFSAADRGESAKVCDFIKTIC